MKLIKWGKRLSVFYIAILRLFWLDLIKKNIRLEGFKAWQYLTDISYSVKLLKGCRINDLRAFLKKMFTARNFIIYVIAIEEIYLLFTEIFIIIFGFLNSFTFFKTFNEINNNLDAK